MKKCSKCQQLLTLSQFYKNKARSDGYQNYCKLCGYAASKDYASRHRWQAVVRTRIYQINNPEKTKATKLRTRLKYKDEIAEKSRIYRQAHLKEYAERQHRRRATMQNNGVYLVTDKELKKLYSSPCYYCGSKDRITLDHIIPIIKGGTHSIGNLIAACKSCNSQKNRNFLTVWKKNKKQLERPRDGY